MQISHREANTNSWRDNINSSVECTVSQTRVTVQHSADIATQDSVLTQLHSVEPSTATHVAHSDTLSYHTAPPPGRLVTWPPGWCRARDRQVWQTLGSRTAKEQNSCDAALCQSCSVYRWRSVRLSDLLSVCVYLCLSICLCVCICVCLSVCLVGALLAGERQVWLHSCGDICYAVMTRRPRHRPRLANVSSRSLDWPCTLTTYLLTTLQRHGTLLMLQSL